MYSSAELMPGQPGYGACMDDIKMGWYQMQALTEFACQVVSIAQERVSNQEGFL